MPTSEEELQAKQETNDDLRDQIAAEKVKQTELQQELSDQLTAAQLDAETAKLEAELADIKRTNDALEEGASGPLDAAKAEMEHAVAQAEAAEAAAEEKAKADAEQEQGESSVEVEETAAMDQAAAQETEG